MFTTERACRAYDCVFSSSARLTIFLDAATSCFFTSMICSRIFIVNYSWLVMWLKPLRLFRFQDCQRLQDTRPHRFYMHACNEVPSQHWPTPPHFVPSCLHRG